VTTTNDRALLMGGAAEPVMAPAKQMAAKKLNRIEASSAMPQATIRLVRAG